jgi:NAD(P)-dependent dehydrogenase (short-subunit alcohol dehydrogenase family)
MKLKDKVAVVTGAGGGIGRVYCRALAAEGARVVAADLNPATAEATAEAVASAGGTALAVPVDITDMDSVQEMAARARERFGGVDILVNNAALMAEIPRAGLLELPLEEWDRVLSVNLTGALRCARACVPAMRERGGGKIVNQSSGGAFTGGGVYGVSKLGLVGLTVSLAQQLGRFNIQVNAIAPGPVDTDAGFRALPAGEMRERVFANVVGKNPGAPEDLCGALVFLASSDSDWMTGQTLNVDGGWVMRI